MATPPRHVQEKQWQDPKPLSWGLKRLTSGGPLTNVEDYGYTYDNKACGDGVTIYILGGTIQATHVDFNYSTPVICDKSNTDKSNEYPNPRIGLPNIDGIDYGTFVAAIAAGSGSGVAKKATIVQVPMNDITKATDKILLDKKVLMAKALKGYHAVVNISSGYANTPEVNGSLVKLIKEGIHVVIAAGDDNLPLEQDRDLKGEGQEHIKNVIWVGASTSGDEKWENSNYGPGVDLFAPGQDITSATRSSDDIYSVKIHSGTAFAAPHVTGIIACLLSHPSYKDFTPESMKKKILAMAEQNAVNNVSEVELVRGALRRRSIFCITQTYTQTELSELFTKEAKKMVQDDYIQTLLPLLENEAEKIWKVFEKVEKSVDDNTKNLTKEGISQLMLDVGLLASGVGPVLVAEFDELIRLHYAKTEDELRQLFKAKALEMVKETYIDEHLLPLMMTGVQEIKKVVQEVSESVEDEINRTLEEADIHPSTKDLFTTTRRLASCRLDR